MASLRTAPGGEESLRILGEIPYNVKVTDNNNENKIKGNNITNKNNFILASYD